MTTLRAEIDWIEIEITIQGTTNLKAMRRALAEAACIEAPYVEIMEDDRNSASTFRFRLQDPNKFASASAVLSRLDQRFPFATPAVVTAAEFALDDYSKGAEKVADWYYGLSKLADRKNHRLYRDFKGSGIAIPRHRDSLVRKIVAGYQIGIGNRSSNFYQHGYFKQTDHNKQTLPASKHRARIEVTLRGVQLPCVTLAKWKNFKFEQLADYFRFRIQKDNLSDFEAMILEGRQIGEKVPRNRKGGGMRLNNPLTKADPENERVRNALRNLSRRWKSPHPGRPPKESACGNSGNISTQSADEYRGSSVRSNNYTSTTSIPTWQHTTSPSEEGRLPVFQRAGSISNLEGYKVSPRISVLKTERK